MSDAVCKCGKSRMTFKNLKDMDGKWECSKCPSKKALSEGIKTGLDEALAHSKGELEAKESRKALNELTSEAQSMGLYETEEAPKPKKKRGRRKKKKDGEAK